MDQGSRFWLLQAQIRLRVQGFGSCRLSFWLLQAQIRLRVRTLPTRAEEGPGDLSKVTSVRACEEKGSKRTPGGTPPPSALVF